MKRLLDIVISLIALLLLSPIFLYVAYKVRKNLGSPIFFFQERPGRNGKLFKMKVVGHTYGKALIMSAKNLLSSR